MSYFYFPDYFKFKNEYDNNYNNYDNYDDDDDTDDEDYECPICKRGMGSRLTVEFDCCDHEVCNGCFLRFVNNKIANGSPQIGCPVCLKPDLNHDSRRNRKHIDWLLDYVKPLIFHKNYDRLLDIMDDHQDKFDPGFLRCPKCAGGFICRWRTGHRNTEAKCRHCEHRFTVDANGNIVNKKHCSCSRTARHQHSAGAADMPQMHNNDQYALFKCSRCKAAVPVEDDHSQYHLCALIRRHRVDPPPMLGLPFCVEELRRLRLPMPTRRPFDTDAMFQATCELVLRQQGPPLEW